MTSRTLLFSTSVAFVLAAVGACGDDTTGSGGTGGDATSSTSASTSSASVASASATSSSSTSSTTGGTGGAGGGDGGAGGGVGGQGGAACTPDDDLGVLEEPPALLSETGLYLPDSLDVDPRMRAFSPEFPLWSDGLDKSRWIYLPPCESIDTSDLDRWDFPVGTRAYKEFRIGDERIETRVLHRFRDDDDELTSDWWFAAYQWTLDGDAVHVPDGVLDANGTDHDIPSASQCVQCHGPLHEGSLPQKLLGFGAIQLAHEAGAGELGLAELVETGRLTSPPDFEIAVPALNATEREALGYLHANCGHCHTQGGVFLPNLLEMRLSVFDADREDTGVFQTAVGVPLDGNIGGGVTHRINPGDPATSCVSYRMGTRPGMPPVGTEVVDEDGKANIEAWITSLE